MKYCIDTSALLDGWNRWYPPSVFPTLWTKIESLIEERVIVSSEEVLRDLDRKDDEVLAWAKRRSEMFLPLDDDVQAAVSEIMAAFPTLVDARTGKSFADPFVVATARVTSTIVVTGEHATGKPRRPKIPDVCLHFGVKSINLVELLRRERWTL